VIRDFDESEKVLHTMQTLGGSQDVTFLTEKGLYKVLFRSRKPIAQKFQNWVCEVIKEIRLKGIYKMQTEINKAIEEKNEAIEEKNEAIEEKNEAIEEKNEAIEEKNEAIEEKNKIREKTLIDNFPSNVQCVYYGTIENKSEKGERLIKFGNSNCLKNRIYKHKKKCIQSGK
jgi:prophage antirepressor-like protein